MSEENFSRHQKRIDISKQISITLAPTFKERVRAVNLCEVLTFAGLDIKEAIEVYKNEILPEFRQKKPDMDIGSKIRGRIKQ